MKNESMQTGQSDTNGQGTQPAGQPPKAATPAAANVPSSTREGDSPKLKELRLTDQTVYKVPEDFELPEVIQKGIVEKDKTIAALKEKEKVWREQLERFETIEQALGNLAGAALAQEENIPDPYENPKEYANYVQEKAAEVAEQRAAQRERLFLSTVKELDELQRLTGGDQEKFEAVIAHIRNMGWGVQQGDQYYLNPNSVRAAYRDLFWEEQINQAKGEGINQVQDTLVNAQSAPGGIPAEGAANAPRYRSLAEFLQKDPAGFQRAKREASLKFGFPQKTNK